jgi:cell division protein FtsI/penicillin-binding protein 2
LFDGRIRWILAALAGLWFVFLCRVFFLQTWESGAAREAVARRSEESIPLPPRRGTIRDADGRVLAKDEVGFDLMADAFGLGAVEWECDCGRVSRTYEADPGPGPADLPPELAPRPRACSCGAPEDRWVPTYAADRVALADHLGVAPEELAADLRAARMEGWAAARTAAEGRDARWRKQILRDRLTRPRVVRRNVGREAAMEVLLNPERYPGLTIDARARRVLDEGLDPATRMVVGKAGPLLKEELDGLVAELHAEGLTIDGAKAKAQRLARLNLGRSGVERTFDRALRGDFGLEHKTLDVTGRVTDRETDVPVRDGEDLRLTISTALQAEAEALLEGRKGAFVALDPWTGAVLVLAGTGGLEEKDPLPAVTGIRPGSVLKSFTALVAEEGGLSPLPGDVRCLGSRSKPVSCEHDHGSPGLREALAGSCNAYFGETGIRIGVRPFEDFARRVLIHKPLGLGVSREGGGTDWTQDTYKRPWNRYDLANVAIGQGPVDLSPLQVTVLHAAIANGGRPVKPHLVEGRGAPPGEPVFSAASIAAVRAGLEETVRSGTAADAGLGRFRAAGKTGTAEVHKGTGRWNAWFAGYAPAEAPRIAIAVVLVEHPGSGGHAAAPLAARFLEAWERREASRK